MTDRIPNTSDKYDFLDGMERMGQGALGKEIVEAAERAVWTETQIDTYPLVIEGSRMWQGTAPKGKVEPYYYFTVVEFDLGPQGFPGQFGADGAVRVGNFVFRTGHVFSSRLIELAKKGDVK